MVEINSTNFIRSLELPFLCVCFHLHPLMTFISSTGLSFCSFPVDVLGPFETSIHCRILFTPSRSIIEKVGQLFVLWHWRALVQAGVHLFPLSLVRCHIHLWVESLHEVCCAFCHLVGCCLGYICVVGNHIVRSCNVIGPLASGN